MLFFVRFDVTQPANVSNEDLIGIWMREAEAAIGAMDAGAVPHLWKVAGQRVVLGVIDLPTAEDLDGLLERLAAEGIEPEKPPYAPGGREEFRICFVADPDGYRIELIDGEFQTPQDPDR